MTKEEIIYIGRKSGLKVGPSLHGSDEVWGTVEDLERFARLVAKRTWVGLTDEEINLLAKAYSTMEGELNAPAFARAILRKAQEK